MIYTAKRECNDVIYDVINDVTYDAICLFISNAILYHYELLNAPRSKHFVKTWTGSLDRYCNRKAECLQQIARATSFPLWIMGTEQVITDLYWISQNGLRKIVKHGKQQNSTRSGCKRSSVVLKI